ncbi:MAG: helix-turn-helix transcriptional regulator [Sutterellaceae bacterium]|nr:helix-turn-helix transcriptional regulator [Sutterellaceae bacterium]
MRTPPKMTHDEMIAQWKKDPEFLKECEKIKPEFDLLARVLDARKSMKMTQADVAARMNTHRETVARMERQLADGKLPTLTMLERYAQALGKRLDIRFV